MITPYSVYWMKDARLLIKKQYQYEYDVDWDLIPYKCVTFNSINRSFYNTIVKPILLKVELNESLDEMELKKLHKYLHLWCDIDNENNRVVIDELFCVDKKWDDVEYLTWKGYKRCKNELIKKILLEDKCVKDCENRKFELLKYLEPFKCVGLNKVIKWMKSDVEDVVFCDLCGKVEEFVNRNEVVYECNRGCVDYSSLVVKIKNMQRDGVNSRSRKMELRMAFVEHGKSFGSAF